MTTPTSTWSSSAVVPPATPPRLYAGSAGLSVGARRAGQGRRDVPAPSAASRPRSCSRRRRSAGRCRTPATFGIRASEPTASTSTSPRQRKQKVVDQLSAGLTGLLKRRKVTTFDGTGTARRRRVGHRRGRRAGDVELTGDAVILAAGSVPRTLPGFDIDGELVMTSDELLELRSTARRGRGDRRRRHRVRVRLDDGRPRHHGDDPRGAPKILPGVDNDIAEAVTRSFEKPRHRGAHRRRSPATPRATAAAPPSTSSRRRRPRRRPGGDVGRPPPVPRPARPRGDGGQGRRARLRDRRRVLQHRGARRLRLGDLVATPQLAHVGFAEAILVVQHLLGEVAGAHRLRPGAVGHLLPSRGGLRRADRGAGRAAGHDVVVVQAPLRRQQPGADPGRDRRPGEDHRREDARRDRRTDPRRAHGGAVGDRAAGPGLPGRELGGHRRRGRRLHPAPPHAVASCSARRCWP